jgi:hypothetical protein
MAKAKKSTKKSKVKKSKAKKAKVKKTKKTARRAVAASRGKTKKSKAKTPKKAARKAVKAKAKPAKRKAPAVKKAAAPRKKKQTVGEGDYQASRNFLKDEAEFVRRHAKEIPALGKEAEAALEGPEGGELRAAEEEARSHNKAGDE